MSEIRILVGLPGSGKTTYARYLERFRGYVRLTNDEVAMMPNKIGVQRYMQQKIEESIKGKKNVVVDGAYITRSDRIKLIHFGKSLKAKIVICVLEANTDECIKHNDEKKDNNKPSAEIIRNMESRYEKPTRKESRNIEIIDTDKWFEEHAKEVELINKFNYEGHLRNQITAIRLSNVLT